MRRATGVVGVLLLAIAAGPAEASGQAAKRCAAGQVAWEVEGRTTCVRSARPPAAPAGSVATAAARLLRTAATDVRGLRRPRVPERARRALRRSTARITALVAQVEQRARTLARAPRPTAARARGPRRLLAAQAVEGGSVTTRQGGTTLTATVGGSLADDGLATIALGITAREAGGGSTEFRTTMESDDTKPTTALCPGADGEVVVERRTGGSLTTITRRGGRVERAETIRTRTVTRSVGRIGPDGTLSQVASTATTTTSINRRGLELVVATRSAVAGAAGRAGAPSGTPTATATVKADGLGGRERQATEREIASRAADLTGRDERAVSDDVRRQLEGAAANWQSTEDPSGNRCLEVVWTPLPGTKLAVGRTRGVQATLRLRASGAGVPTATWRVDQNAVGSFTGGGGGAFTATGAGPDGRFTVDAQVVATSPAGRVRGGWFAADVPRYVVRIALAGTATLATHDARGDLEVIDLTVTDPSDAAVQVASKPVSWSGIVFTSKEPSCTYTDPVGTGTATVRVDPLGEDRLRVRLDFSEDTKVDATVQCTGGPPIQGQPGPRPLNLQPLEWTLPTDGGVQAITGDVSEGDSSFRTTGTVEVRPNV
jgi:hypothetical protein